MKLEKIITSIIILLCCTLSFADAGSKEIVFNKTKNNSSGIIIHPFSLDLPKGYIKNQCLFISLNPQSETAIITIYKNEIKQIYDITTIDNNNYKIDYDLSFYGNGVYKVIVKIPKIATYEGCFVIE